MIGIIQGDVRYTYLSQMLSDSIISNKLEDFYDVDTLILPLKGIDHQYRIPLTNFSLLDILKYNRIKKIYTGNANIELKKICKENNIHLYEFLKDDSFIRQNAFLTAKGLLYFLHQGDVELSEYKILILGYGNIAFYLAKIMRMLHVQFKIYAEEEMELKFAELEGYETTKNIDDTYDMIINTIPKNLDIDYAFLKNIKIVDVASAPYGFDMNQIEKYHINYSILSAIPSKFSAASAAKIILKFIENNS